MNVVATQVAVGLFAIEQSAFWAATLWNVGMFQIELGARMILPPYQDVRPRLRVV